MHAKSTYSWPATAPATSTITAKESRICVRRAPRIADRGKRAKTILPPIVGDPTLFRQVWTNLLSDAITFSSKEGRAVIEVNAVQQDDEIVYSVRDNGAGFNMQYVDKPFGVFQRLHSTKEFEGTGVGPAILQRIILRHGGRIWGEGEIGKGTTFYFTVAKTVMREG